MSDDLPLFERDHIREELLHNAYLRERTAGGGNYLIMNRPTYHAVQAEMRGATMSGLLRRNQDMFDFLSVGQIRLVTSDAVPTGEVWVVSGVPMRVQRFIYQSQPLDSFFAPASQEKLPSAPSLGGHASEITGNEPQIGGDGQPESEQSH